VVEEYDPFQDSSKHQHDQELNRILEMDYDGFGGTES
jgi:hypothetical protein